MASKNLISVFRIQVEQMDVFLLFSILLSCDLDYSSVGKRTKTYENWMAVAQESELVLRV